MANNVFIYIKDGESDKIAKKLKSIPAEGTIISSNDLKNGMFSFFIQAMLEEKEKNISMDKLDYIEDKFFNRFKSLYKAISEVIESDEEFYSM